PLNGLLSPQIARSVVVLPAPLWPTIVTISPAPTRRVASKTTDLRAYPAVSSRTLRTSAVGGAAGLGGSWTVGSGIAEVNLRESRLFYEVRHAALGGNGACFHEVHPVRQPLDDVEIVFHQADSLPHVPRLEDDVEDRLEPAPVDPGGRLIEQQHTRFGRKHACQRDQFLLTVSKRARRHV